MLDLSGLHCRAALFQAIRNFFNLHGFLEVDTPVRQPVIIPESNIEPVMAGEYFLQSSPEVFMKRLLAAGCKDIFQLCNCYRRNERGAKHLEEFTMLEWYRTGKDYFKLMNDCEELFRHLQSSMVQKGKLQGFPVSKTFQELDLHQPFERCTVAQVFERYSTHSLDQVIRDDCFEEVLVEQVEPHLGVNRPMFVYDYPVEFGSLARTKREDAGLVERFELYLHGIELANGFSELTDVQEQRLRFESELKYIEKKWGRQQNIPERFLEELSNLDEAAGIAFGIDRLLMVVMDKQQIDEVISFSCSDM